MSTKKICSRIFNSRKICITLCSLAAVLIIGLICGAWIVYEEKEISLVVNGNEVTVKTYARNVSDFLEEQDIVIDRIADSYPHNEAIEVWKYVIGLYKGLFSKGDFGFYYLRMNEYSGRLSRRYAMNGEREQCLEELKNSVEYLKAFLEWAKGSEKEKHTSLLLNRLEMSRRYTNTSGRPMSFQTMEDIKRQCYDPYREDPEFIRIKSELEAIHNEGINK